MAIDLFKDDELPKGVKTHGFVTGADLLELAKRFDLLDHRARAVVDEICSHRDKANELVERSFLSEAAKKLYIEILDDRRHALEIR